MKKIIIVNNNMKVGGVQKSLCNLLWALEKNYDVTLLLFHKAGAYLQDIPAGVRVLETGGPFYYLGISQGECKGVEKLKRGALAAFCKLFGRKAVVSWMLRFQKSIMGEYDHAIAFLHNGNPKSFYGGVQEYVLNKVKAFRKTAFLHCDYAQCGANTPDNNKLLEQFDGVAACSEGCANALLGILPHLQEKCFMVRNCHRYDRIYTQAVESEVVYDPAQIHLLVVARLAHEKGVERAVEAAFRARKEGIPVVLHIVGGGPMERSLKEQTSQLQLQDYVDFQGEQSNPYRYMKNADLLLVPSYHEAAPMVIEEAASLGVPVLTTDTTSVREMVLQRQGGWVCGNNTEAFCSQLIQILKSRKQLEEKKALLCSRRADNICAKQQFAAMIEGNYELLPHLAQESGL